MTTEKKAFVPPEERPHVGIQPDTPLSELRVRDLSELLAGAIVQKTSNAKLTITDTKPFFENKQITDINEGVKNYRDHLAKNYKDHLIDAVKPAATEHFQLPGVQGDPIEQLVNELTKLSEQVAELDKKVQGLTEQRH